MTPATHTARVLGALYGAHTLLTQAKTVADERHALDVGPLLAALNSEIQSLEEDLQHDLGHQIAALLPDGFSYSPE
jgi:hypothetical protein